MRRGALLVLAAMLAGVPAAAEPLRLLVARHATDARLGPDEALHLVVYDRAATGTRPLLVWLAGANGHPATGPAKLFETVLEQGYRLVGVS